MRRSLSTRERLRLFTLHGGVCWLCGGKIDGTREKWDIDHRVPLALGGEDDDQNRQPAHYKCHKAKSADDVGQIRKADRQQARHLGAKPRKSRPLAGTVASGWRHKMDGSWERR